MPFGAISRVVLVAPSTSTPAAKVRADSNAKQQTSKNVRLHALFLFFLRSIETKDITTNTQFGKDYEPGDLEWN